MIIPYYTPELPSTDEQATRIYELERALETIMFNLADAHRCVSGEPQDLRPTCAAISIRQAMRTIDAVI